MTHSNTMGEIRFNLRGECGANILNITSKILLSFLLSASSY